MSQPLAFMAEVGLANCAEPESTSQPARLVGNRVDLVAAYRLRLTRSDAPIQVFHILDKEALVIGEASLVLESERQNVQYEGHFGGTFPGRAMDPEIMAETARLLFPVARQHGMTEILITTRKGDKLVEKACELLEARPLDFLQVQQPYTKKRIDIRRFVVAL